MTSLSDLQRKLEALESKRTVAPAAAAPLVAVAPVGPPPVVVPVYVPPPPPATFFWERTLEQLLTEERSLSNEAQRLVETGVLQQVQYIRNEVSTTGDSLRGLLGSIGVDTSKVVAWTASAEADDHSELIQEMPCVWAQSTDDHLLLHERSEKIHTYKKIVEHQKCIASCKGAADCLVALRRREKRLKNDVNEARVTLEYIQAIEDRAEHVGRMVQRSAVDEEAIFNLNRATVFEEEKAKRHLAANDSRGLKAIAHGPKMKALKEASVVPESERLQVLESRMRSARRTLFEDVGKCRSIWAAIEKECEEILVLVKTTSDSRAARRAIADKAYHSLQDALGHRTIEMIR